MRGFTRGDPAPYFIYVAKELGGNKSAVKAVLTRFFKHGWYVRYDEAVFGCFTR
jgi:hypothetical protein